ncbi:MAG: hypothetical protein RI897_3426 [Verrucomicrobiota bacterium]
MVAVDVLGQDPGARFMVFDVGEDFVAVVGAGFADGFKDLP